MSETIASVNVLTAEVRTLMVGNRQVTQSVYRQLDWVNSSSIEPFGRVADSKIAAVDEYGIPAETVAVVGRCVSSGALVRAYRRCPTKPAPARGEAAMAAYRGRLRDYEAWEDLPLIVLAGLR